MKVVDIHPEELIDKLTAGDLSPGERERLDAHLAQCSSCRFEIGVRADLEQEAPLFEQRPQLTVAGQQAAPRALLASESGMPEQAAPRVKASLRARSGRRWPLVLLAAGLVLCAGGAMAAVITGSVAAPTWLPWAPERQAAGPAETDAKLPSKNKRAPKLALSAAPTAASAVAPSAPEVAPSSLEAPALQPGSPVGNARPVLVARGAPQAARGIASAVDSDPPSIAAFPSPPADGGAQSPAQSASADPALPEPDPAASLFSEANHARRDGNVDRAVALYHSLQTRYPSSSESELSRALLAQLLLDRGNPEQALAGFDRYLAQDAPVLGAEALVGRARALEQLGKLDQATAAWKQVQSRFPGSVHARLAAARLAALGMR